MELANRHVVVTGGSRGIGPAIGRAFAAAGATVTLVARTEPDLAAAASEIGTGYLVPDLLDLAALPALAGRLEEIAPIGVLVNNAGLGTPGRLEEMTADALRRDLCGSGVGVTTAELGPIDTGLYDEATSYEPCADAFDRMLRLGILSMLSPGDVATSIVRACRKDHARVVLPRRAAAQVVSSHLPQWVANRVL